MSSGKIWVGNNWANDVMSYMEFMDKRIGGGCTTQYYNDVCGFGNNIKVKFPYGGEYYGDMDMPGFLVYENVHLMATDDWHYVVVDNNYDESGILESAVSATFIDDSGNSLTVVSPVVWIPASVSDEPEFWVVGCFAPKLGLSSFHELNYYTDNSNIDTSDCPQ